MSNLSQCSNRRPAITLVEVVVSLVLLASLLVGMVTAFSAHHRQGRLAHERLLAVEATDELLARWHQDSESRVPRLEEGILLGAENTYLWRTAPVHRSTIETLPVEIIRLQVFSNQALRTSSAPLVQVDLLLPVKEPTL